MLLKFCGCVQQAYSFYETLTENDKNGNGMDTKRDNENMNKM